MRLRFFLLVTVASLAPVLVQAQTSSEDPPPGWKYAAESGNGVLYFVHTSSVIRNGNKAEAWLLINNPELQRDSSGKSYKSEKHLKQFNCDQRTTIIKSMTYYDSDMGRGNSVYNYNKGSSDQEAYPVMPDSVGEAVFNAVCKKSGTKKPPSSSNSARDEKTIAEQVAKAKNANPYLVHWENNDPAAWNEALRQDEILRAHPQWVEKSYDVRFAEVVRRVRAIMPEASAP